MYRAARSPATQLLNLSAPMLMMVSMVIAPSVHAQATSPPPSPSNWADMPAQQLVQKLFADEAWIWQADTMLIEYDFIKNLSRHAVQENLQRNKDRSPQVNWDDQTIQKKLIYLRETTTGKDILAWNKTKLFRRERLDSVSDVKYLWNGSYATRRVSKTYRDKEHCFLDKGIGHVSFTAQADFWWQRIRSFPNWWASSRDFSPSYTDTGVRERDGMKYRVLKNTRQDTYLWVNLQTGFLEYLASFKDGQPFSEYECTQWDQVAPGKHFPSRQTYRYWSREGEHAGSVAMTSQWRLTRLVYNQPLPDGTFEIELSEGLMVSDDRYGTNLNYTYQANRSDEEWRKILTLGQQMASRSDKPQTIRDALIGTKAPEIKAKQWLHSQPISLGQLKGKLVVLDFFAEWCGPCRAYYPLLAKWTARSDLNDDLVIIGVHTAGLKQQRINKIIDQYHLQQLPIAVDHASSPADGWGNTYRAYGVNAIPTSLLIDRKGNVVIYGDLDKVLRKAEQMIQPSKGR